MIPVLAALALTLSTPLEDKALVGYSGIPQVSGQNILLQFHNVTLTVAGDHVDVFSVTLVKNHGPAGTCEIDIPAGQLGGALPPSNITATWANAPVELKPAAAQGQGGFTATVPVQNLGSYALRIKYSEPIGRCGMDHKRLVAAYGLQSSVPIDTLMVTYAYSPGVVFHLPEVGPGQGWQVGRKGAFLKRSHYDGKSDLTFCAFYPAGFGSFWPAGP